MDCTWHQGPTLVNLKYANTDNLNLINSSPLCASCPRGSFGCSAVQSSVCNLKRETEYEKYKILCGIFSGKLYPLKEPVVSQGETEL